MWGPSTTTTTEAGAGDMDSTVTMATMEAAGVMEAEMVTEMVRTGSREPPVIPVS